MVLAGLQHCRFPGRPSGPVVRWRVMAAAPLAGAAASAMWSPVWEVLKRDIRAEASPAPNKPLPSGTPGGTPGTPPWLQPADDGLDAVRQRIREYGCRSVEEKLISLLREFRQDEAKYLRRFAAAEAEGDEGMMRIYHSNWKSTTKRMELLLSDPRKFVHKHGYLYGIDD